MSAACCRAGAESYPEPCIWHPDADGDAKPVEPAPDTSGRAPDEAPATVNPKLTLRRRSKRARKSVEALEFIGAIRRFLRAAGSRVADSDEYELCALLALRVDLDEAIGVAVQGQKSIGRSWAYIALATGTTRQAAQQKWGTPNE